MQTQSTTTTQSTTMNEATMQGALHDLLVTAGLSPTQGMNLPCDHTGAYPQLGKDGAVFLLTSGDALATLRRYLAAVQAEWSWCLNGTKADPSPGMGLDATTLTHANAAHMLNTTYHVGGKNPRTVGALAYGLMKVRRAARAVVKAEARTEAEAILDASGGCFYAEGVVFTSGARKGEQMKFAVIDAAKQPNLNASQKHAQKAWARAHYGKNWWAEVDANGEQVIGANGRANNHPEKANRLAQAVTQRGPFTTTALSEDTLKVRAVQTTATTVTAPAPAATAGTIVDIGTGEAATIAAPVTIAAPATTAPVDTAQTVSIPTKEDRTINAAKSAGYGSRGGQVNYEGAVIYLKSLTNGD